MDGLKNEIGQSLNYFDGQTCFLCSIYFLVEIASKLNYTMKLYLFLLTTMTSVLAFGQVFDQILPLDQITKNDSAYVVTTAGDTLRGRLTGYSGGNKKLLEATLQDSDLEIYNITLRLGKKDKIDIPVDTIRLLAILPTLGMAQFEQTNLGGDLLEFRRVMKDPYMQKLFEGLTFEDFEAGDRWIYYETIKATYLDTKLFSSKWDWELRQLLNPNFDSRIKVYPEINKEIAENENSTEIMGVRIESNMANAYILSVDGEPLRRVQNLGYSRKAKEEIYKNCEIIEDKPQWKNLALDIFKAHRECGNQ